MKKIIESLFALLAIATLIISTIFFFIPILLVGLVKLIPSTSIKARCARLADKIVAGWSSVNNGIINSTKMTQWEFRGLTQFKRKEWYLLVANHQSWLDIVVLQRLFNRRIPMLKFFVKQQLIWVPLLGFAWWAMGLPFMKRYSSAYLKKNPHKKGKDLETTYKALTLFRKTPVTITNFIEGTRFTNEKHQSQNSPYKHLLRPKAGGIGFVLSSMGNQIHCILDVTIAYPKGQASLWDFLCRRLSAIKVHVREIEIPSAFLHSSLPNNPELQAAFRDWLNDRWLEKDAILADLKMNFTSALSDEETDDLLDTEFSGYN